MVEVISAEDESALREFVSFRKQVYRHSGLSLPPSASEPLSFFRHETPYSEGRRFQLMLSRDGHRVVARAVAVHDQRYNQHWGERLGHLVMFEALPSSHEASRLLVDKACEWFRDQGLLAVRAGFGPFEPGFIIDDYATFLLRMTRHNPPYYHSLLKYAGFDTEKGAGEYIIKVSEELVARYRGYLQSAQRTGYDIIPLRGMPASQRVTNFTSTWNEAYKSHWGLAPLTESEFATLFDQPGDTTTLDLSAIAYRDGHAVGVGLVRKEGSVRSSAKWRLRIRQQNELERLNSFAVGVSPSDRGRGVSLALASHAYLQLVSRGAKYLSYGLVVDDNRPSRRVAEKLGSYACVNYLTYRKTLPGSPRESDEHDAHDPDCADDQ